ncbi:MAG: hypothetical protein RLY71_1984 [Pseudomonadota bacterium]|jgi:hypothetical protein
MSQQARSVLDISVQASGAIAYGRAVNLIAPLTPRGQSAVQTTTSGGKIFGISRRAAADGEWTEVTCLGTAVCEAGAAIVVGARVQCDAVGRVITATALGVSSGATAVTAAAANGAAALTGGDPPVYVFGTAMQAASAAGDWIEVLICP